MKQLEMFQYSFHNTVNETGPTLDSLECKAKRLEDDIYQIMADGKPRSAWQVWQVFEAMGRSPLLTSVRRGLTNLTTEGKLIKTDTKVPGPFGVHIYQYKLNDCRNS